MCVRESGEVNPLEIEGEWEQVSYKKRHNINVRKGSGEGSGDRIVKFFVSNIPDGCRPWDLSSTLKSFGNKLGLRFGFVSFKDVSKWEEMEDSLKNIKMGNHTLNINIARFAAENEKMRDGAKVDKEGASGRRVANVFSGRPSFLPQRNSSAGVSYSEVVKGAPSFSSKEKVIQVEEKDEVMSSVHGRAVIARCSNFESLSSISSLMGSIGMHGRSRSVRFNILGASCC